MKRIITVFAFLTVFLGVKAELSQDYKIDYSAYNGAGDLNMLSDEDYNALIDAMSAQNEYELIPEKIE